MKKRSAFRSALLVAAVIGLACDCMRSSEGVVTDSATGAAIEGVQCKVTNGTAATATDAAGHYRVEGLFGAGFPARHCPDLQVEFSKAGYRTVTLANPGDVKLEAL